MSAIWPQPVSPTLYYIILFYLFVFLGELKRFNKDVIAHNEAAKEVVAKHGFIINDLYEITKDIPESYYSDMTHLYTKEGTKLLTDKVVECIENCLDIKAKKLDYDKFGLSDK